MHHRDERRSGVPACHCVCISMYKQMYTHTYIIQHLNMDRKFPYTIHHIKLSKRLLLYLEVQIYIQLLFKTADTEHLKEAHQLAYASHITCLGYLLRGNTNTQCTIAEGQLVKTNTYTDTFPAAPTLS